jgi:hypothetical protein
MFFSRSNLERLLKLEGTFDRLSLSIPKEDFVVDAFAVKVNVFHYTVDNRKIEPKDFHDLDIVTKDLGLKIVVKSEGGCLK